MAERLAYLEAVVGADITQFRKGMRDIRNEAGVLSESMNKIGNAGRNMTYMLTVPLVAFASAAVAAAGKFDGAMRNINSLARLSTTELDELGQSVLRMGAETVSGPQALAESLYEVYSAGLEGQDAFDIMAESVKLAESGLSDLEKTTNALTATMLVYGSTGIDAAEASNIWARMVQLGVGELDEFVSNAQKVLPLNKALGVSFKDLGGTIAFVSQAGGGAKKAETALGMMASNLLKPNLTLAAAYDKLGVSTGQELIAKFGTLGAAVMALKNTTVNAAKETGFDDNIFAKMFSKTGLEAAILITEDGGDRFRATLAQFDDGLDTATLGAWEQQMMGFPAVMGLFTSAVQGAAIVIGQKLLPLVTPIIQGLTQFLLGVMDLNPQILQMAVAFGAVVAAAGPVLWLIASLVSPIGLVMGSVAALAIGIATDFGGIRTTITNAIKDILGPLDGLVKVFNDFWAAVFPEQMEKPKMEDYLPTPGEVNTSDYITITGPTNVGELFKEYGFEGEDWKDFRDRIIPQIGGSGRVIEIGEIIQVGGGAGGVDTTAVKLSMMEYEDAAAEYEFWESQQPPNIFAAIAQGAEEVFPNLELELGKIFDHMKGWFDLKVGEGLNWIAGLFSGELDLGGEGDLYTATTKLLHGDIIGAIRDISAPVADALKGIFDGIFGGDSSVSNAEGVDEMMAAAGLDMPAIEKSESGIAAGLSNLVSSIGSWLIDEGIPIVAESIGFFVGRIGALIGEGLGAMWASLHGGGAEEAQDVIGDAVVTPLMKGVQAGLNSSGVNASSGPQGAIDAFASGLAGALALALGVVALWSGVGTAVSMGVTGAIAVAKFTTMSILPMVFKIVTTVGGALISGFASKAFMAIISTKVGSSIMSAILPTSGNWGFKGFAKSIFGSLKNRITSFMPSSGWASGITGKIKGAFGSALSGIKWAGAKFSGMVGGLMGGISAGFSSLVTATAPRILAIVSTVTGALSTAFAAAAAGVSTAMAGISTFAGGVVAALGSAIMLLPISLGIALGTLLYLAIPESFKQSIRDGFAGLFDGIFGEAAWQTGLDQLEADVLETIRRISNIAQGGEGASDDLLDIAIDVVGPATGQASAWGYTVEPEVLNEEEAKADAMGLMDGLAAGTQAILDEAPMILNQRVKLNTLQDSDAQAAAPTDTFTDALTGETMFFDPAAARLEAEAMNAELLTSVNGFGAVIMGAMGEGTAMDAQAIITNFLQPLEVAWLSMFGVDAPMALATTGWQQLTSGAVDTVTRAVLLMPANFSGALSTAATHVQTNSAKMVAEFESAEAAAFSLRAEVMRLLDLDPTFNVNVDVTSNTGQAGDGYKKGLGLVPYDGFQANLHKGERVLTALEAQNYGNLPKDVQTGGSEGTTNNTTTSNDIQMNGLSVDKMLRELERRGIKLGAR